ncbi:hypothetical protein GY45DRAFT_1341604, partial [Cubamyces sp. BRFM 1775]
MSTAPKEPPVTIQDTPLSQHNSNRNAAVSYKPEDFRIRRRIHADDMVEKAVRLSVKQFIDKFWPTPAVGNLPPIPSQNPFADVVSRVAKKAVEKDVADAFTKAVNEYALTPGMQLR